MSNNCSCYDDVLEKVKARSIEEKEIPEGSKDIRFSWRNRVFYFDEGDNPPVSITLDCSFRKLKKGGDYATNTTKKETGIIANYCPFCGRKYAKTNTGE